MPRNAATRADPDAHSIARRRARVRAAAHDAPLDVQLAARVYLFDIGDAGVADDTPLVTDRYFRSLADDPTRPVRTDGGLLQWPMASRSRTRSAFAFTRQKPPHSL